MGLGTVVIPSWDCGREAVRPTIAFLLYECRDKKMKSQGFESKSIKRDQGNENTPIAALSPHPWAVDGNELLHSVLLYFS